MRAKCLFIVISVFSFNSCDLFTENENQIVSKEAVLVWENPAVDGCGFFIEFDNKSYKPENEDIIQGDFTYNSRTLVKIRFIYLNKEIEYYCFDNLYTTEGIKIISMSNI